MRQLFIEFLLKNYREKHAYHDNSDEVGNFLTYLIDQKFIPAYQIRHFTVIAEYHHSQKEKRFKNKTQTIKAIARKFDLHENTIWNILKDHTYKFQHLL